MRQSAITVALLAVVTVTVVNAVPRNVTIDNLKPRLDVNGVIIDAHDGSVQQYGGKGLFYMHAVQYGLCAEPAKYGCDQTPDHCGFRVRGRRVAAAGSLKRANCVQHGAGLPLLSRPNRHSPPPTLPPVYIPSS